MVQEDNSICVWNNGDGVPVEIHKEEKVYVPELIFGHLLTSSNYNDEEQKVQHWSLADMGLLCGIHSLYAASFCCVGDWWQEWIRCQADKHLLH